MITSMQQRWDATAPIAIGRFRISDDHPLGPAAQRSRAAGPFVEHRHRPDRRRRWARSGCRPRSARSASTSRRRSSCASAAAPLWPRDWGRATVLTAGFGHGIAVTPLHLASAYATLVNGGIWRPATLMRVEPGQAPRRAAASIRRQTSDRMRQLLRLIVTNGTGRNADAPGFRVGGKTGTAEKTGGGGYTAQRERFHLRGGFPDGRAALCGAGHDRRSQGNRRHARLRPPPPGPPRRSCRSVISRTGPLLGVIPDESRDIDTSELMPLVGDAEALMRLGALTGSDDDCARHRLRHRPSQGRAGHGVRRLSRRALQRRGLHSRRGRRRRGRGRGAARGAGSRARSTSPPTSRAASSPGSPPNSSGPSRRPWSRSPAPTARPRTSS